LSQHLDPAQGEVDRGPRPVRRREDDPDRVDEATAILQGFPNDGPSRFYLQQAQRLAAQPLPDWDGIVRMATK
jgi:hypothetical protein